MQYKEAIKFPKAGAVSMNYFQMQAQYSKDIGLKQCINPEMIYNWCLKFDIDLAKYGYILADIKYNAEFFGDILNNKLKYTKYLLKPKYRLTDKILSKFLSTASAILFVNNDKRIKVYFDLDLAGKCVEFGLLKIDAKGFYLLTELGLELWNAYQKLLENEQTKDS